MAYGPVGMAKLVCVCSVWLAEFGAVKGLAVVGVCLATYLYWLSFKEKRERRRQEREVKQRRREREAGMLQK
jgi:hypothetical protein